MAAQRAALPPPTTANVVVRFLGHRSLVRLKPDTDVRRLVLSLFVTNLEPNNSIAATSSRTAEIGRVTNV